MATLYSGMGGAQGYGEGSFIGHGADVGNLDDGSIAVDITSVFGPAGISFYGTSYTTLYINTNGNVSFGAANTAYNPASITQPTLSPFFVDINIGAGSATGSNNIYWDLDPTNGTFTVTWLQVAPYNAAGVDTFQLRLSDLGNDHWDMEYVYGDIQYAASGGVTALAGYTDGAGTSVALPGSGDTTSMLAYESYAFSADDPSGVFSQGFQDSGAPICFAAGTRILTARGPVPVQYLVEGELVATRDHGYQPLSWVARLRLGARAIAAEPDLCLVVIERGALGPGLPKRRLKVSAQHRFLCGGPVVQRMFGVAEVLVPARGLVGLPGIAVETEGRGVSYFHLVFARHEIVLAEGVACESLLPAPQSLRQIGPAGRAALTERLPGLRDETGWHLPDPARPLVAVGKGRTLARRAQKNGHSLFSGPGPPLPVAAVEATGGDADVVVPFPGARRSA